MAESTVMKTLNGRKVYDEDARKELENIKNAAPGLVFDTVADMEAYIAENAGALKVGQDLFIREADAPDYWWDGTQAVPVETDLSGVRKELDQLSGAVADKLDADKLPDAVNDALAQAKETGDFDGAPGTTPHIGDNGNWYIGETDTGVAAQGEKGDDYILTDSDKTEIAQEAAALVDTALLDIIGTGEVTA